MVGGWRGSVLLAGESCWSDRIGHECSRPWIRIGLVFSSSHWAMFMFVPKSGLARFGELGHGSHRAEATNHCGAVCSPTLPAVGDSSWPVKPERLTEANRWKPQYQETLHLTSQTGNTTSTKPHHRSKQNVGFLVTANGIPHAAAVALGQRGRPVSSTGGTGQREKGRAREPQGAARPQRGSGGADGGPRTEAGYSL